MSLAARRRGPARLLVAAVLLLSPPAGAADWPGYEKLTREQVAAALAKGSASAPVDFYSKNLSGLDLSGIDFKGANLAAAVLNRSNLTRANLSRCNLTVSFAEGANLSHADLRGAMMFSMQLQDANLKEADLSGARLIGDLRRANLERAVLTKMDASADMKNQSMGLMRANLVSASLKGADLSGSDFSRADFSFSDLSGANLAGAKLSGADFSGTDLRGANLAGADLSGSKLIDTDFTGANLAGADFTAAVLRSVKGLTQTSQAAGDDAVLRVCEDPNNLPFSNRAGEGFENKIAELLARELGRTLEYTWFPQRMGFIRNTLRARDPGGSRFKCDLVMGVPVGFELASTTKPYYRSTYAVVYVKGKGLDSVTAPEGLLALEPAKLRSLKLGVFGQTPPADWLLKHGLFDQVISYQPQSGDPERYPGEMVEKDLVSGKVDVAFVWGPIAGYFAKNAKAAELAVVPFAPSPEIQFDYRIAMGVRFGEREWKDRIERLIEANRPAIQAILAAYGVPQLDDAGRLMGKPGK
jgi:quinoprotein dehydrogenase-associated probable ABC transporter substrate-binding protein